MSRKKRQTDLPDQMLITNYLHGDAEAFNELYKRYRKQIYGYLNRMLNNQQALVDDIFQQTWLKIIHQLPKYRDQYKFLAWALRIAHNLAVDHFRKEKKHQQDVPLDEEHINATHENKRPWHNLDRKELAATLKSALAQLPDEQREVFLLRQEEVSFKEIARIQAASINTVLGRMQYALKNLQKLIGDIVHNKGS